MCVCVCVCVCVLCGGVLLKGYLISSPMRCKIVTQTIEMEYTVTESDIQYIASYLIVEFMGKVH